MDYHTRAQQFIKSSKDKGMTVKAEGGELIAYPQGGTKPKSTLKRYAEKVINTIRPVSNTRYNSGWKNPQPIDANKEKKKREKVIKDEKRYKDIREGRSWTFF